MSVWLLCDAEVCSLQAITTDTRTQWSVITCCILRRNTFSPEIHPMPPQTGLLSMLWDCLYLPACNCEDRDFGPSEAIEFSNDYNTQICRLVLFPLEWDTAPHPPQIEEAVTGVIETQISRVPIYTSKTASKRKWQVNAITRRSRRLALFLVGSTVFSVIFFY